MLDGCLTHSGPFIATRVPYDASTCASLQTKPLGVQNKSARVPLSYHVPKITKLLLLLCETSTTLTSVAAHCELI
jgi:hypothetical protein